VNLILSGRGVDLDDSLRRYATEKFSRVQRFFDRIIKMEVELTEERTRHGVEHRVEVTVATPGDTLRAEGVGVDHFAAIDKVTDRLERQVKRFKNRLIQSHREPKHHLVENDGEIDLDDPEPLIVRRTAQLVKPLEPEEARLELESRGLHFLLFTNAETMRPAVIYRRKDDFGLIEPEN
jgi:putative sigma-54 modulation protein